jgi:hypothetical protein
LEAVVKMTEILAEVAIRDMVIHPFTRYLDGGSLSLGGVYKAVFGTAFDRDHVPLFSLAPTNTC